MAGGVALNCVGNGRVLREGPFENLWIQPAAGDAGGALGAALSAWHQYLDNPRRPTPGDSMRGSYLGPSYSNDEIAAALDGVGARYRRLSRTELIEQTARALADERVVGWMHGRMNR